MAGVLDVVARSVAISSQPRCRYRKQRNHWTDLAASPVASAARASSILVASISHRSLSTRMMPPARQSYVTIMGFSGKRDQCVASLSLHRRGAHWTDISSNLPNAPANSVIVDPNDANTLYVALDTGVYVTTQVTTCTTANCWSVYGTSLPTPRSSAWRLPPRYPQAMAAPASSRCHLRSRPWQIPLLTASGTAQPAIALSSTHSPSTTRQLPLPALPRPSR